MYVTANTKANEWGITERRVQVLCNENRVRGAIKQGGVWLIPRFARKPLDKRNESEVVNDDYDRNVIIYAFAECISIQFIYNENIKYEKDYNKIVEANIQKNAQIFYTFCGLFEKFYDCDLTKYIGADLKFLELYVNNLGLRELELENLQENDSIKIEKQIIEILKDVYELLYTKYFRKEIVSDKDFFELAIKLIEKIEVDEIPDNQNNNLKMMKEYIKLMIDNIEEKNKN